MRKKVHPYDVCLVWLEKLNLIVVEFAVALSSPLHYSFIYTLWKKNVYTAGYCSREPTRRHIAPERERERIEAKRGKKTIKKEKGKEKKISIVQEKRAREREKGWQVIVDHLIWNWYSSSSNYAWTWCTIVIIFGDNIHSHIESNW